MTFPHKMLRDLKPNWNSYGAPAIDERCIQKAFELWRQLHGDWQVVPCTDGGVQLEQHRDGFDIEITVSRAAATKPAVEVPDDRWIKHEQARAAAETSAAPPGHPGPDCGCYICNVSYP